MYSSAGPSAGLKGLGIAKREALLTLVLYRMLLEDMECDFGPFAVTSCRLASLDCMIDTSTWVCLYKFGHYSLILTRRYAVLRS